MRNCISSSRANLASNARSRSSNWVMGKILAVLPANRCCRSVRPAAASAGAADVFRRIEQRGNMMRQPALLVIGMARDVERISDEASVAVRQDLGQVIAGRMADQHPDRAAAGLGGERRAQPLERLLRAGVGKDR